MGGGKVLLVAGAGVGKVVDPASSWTSFPSSPCLHFFDWFPWRPQEKQRYDSTGPGSLWRLAQAALPGWVAGWGAALGPGYCSSDYK